MQFTTDNINLTLVDRQFKGTLKVECKPIYFIQWLHDRFDNVTFNYDYPKEELTFEVTCKATEWFNEIIIVKFIQQLLNVDCSDSLKVNALRNLIAIHTKKSPYEVILNVNGVSDVMKLTLNTGEVDTIPLATFKIGLNSTLLDSENLIVNGEDKYKMADIKEIHITVTPDTIHREMIKFCSSFDYRRTSTLDMNII